MSYRRRSKKALSLSQLEDRQPETHQNDQSPKGITKIDLDPIFDESDQQELTKKD